MTVVAQTKVAGQNKGLERKLACSYVLPPKARHARPDINDRPTTVSAAHATPCVEWFYYYSVVDDKNNRNKSQA